ncbi:hypothetical protein [Salinicola tamaricis]|uniref:hypothetical protein n=1 Tax=Salinicola tamaricis TaxID=1771309 RepID=UPI001F5DDF59|nr:hypothetical protein [Salinicola tamaricis]
MPAQPSRHSTAPASRTRRLLRGVGHLLRALALALVIAWGTLALHFALSGPRPLVLAVIALWVTLGLAALLARPGAAIGRRATRLASPHTAACSVRVSPPASPSPWRCWSWSSGGSN